MIEHVLGHEKTGTAVDVVVVVDISDGRHDGFVPVEFVLELGQITSEGVTRVVLSGQKVVVGISFLVVGDVGGTTPHVGGEAETRVLLGNTTGEVPLGLGESDLRQPAADGFHVSSGAGTLRCGGDLEGEEDIHGGAEGHVELDAGTDDLSVGVDEGTIPEAVGVSCAGARRSPAGAATFVTAVDTIGGLPETERISIAVGRRSVSVEAEADVTCTRILGVKIPATLTDGAAGSNSGILKADVFGTGISEGIP